MNNTTILLSQDRNIKEDWENLVKQVVSQNAWLASTPVDELRTVQERTSALRVAAYWYHFSVFAADFLCLSLPLIQNHASRSIEIKRLKKIQTIEFYFKTMKVC